MKMGYTFDDILSLLEGTLIGEQSTTQIEHLLLDSRKIVFPESALFFALKGAKSDGHLYLEDAYQKGVRHFVISEKNEVKSFPNAHFILVKDTLQALQTLAQHHRLQFIQPIVGITGSNAKTIIKEWLYLLLSEELAVVRSPKSYNSQIGVPLSVWSLKSHHQIAILEAGISEVGEMRNLQKIIQPTIGIFTNIGSAHDAGFESQTQKIQEKLQLFQSVETLIYRSQHTAIHQEIQVSSSNEIKLLSWSLDEKNDKGITYTTLGSIRQQTQLRAVYHEIDFVFSLPFKDAASIENALHCWSLLIHLKQAGRLHKTWAFYTKKVLSLEAMPMRLEQKAGVHNCILIDDAYNADVEALKIALDFQSQQNRHLPNSLILTDILQSGQAQKNLYQSIVHLLQQKKLHRFIGIGSAIGQHQKLFKKIAQQVSFYTTTNDLLQNLEKEDFKNECILFKGARSFQLERVVNALSQKLHRTILEINLNAFANNLQVYRSLLKPDTKIMAMVKAFSYGAGTYQVANILQFHKVDYLAVAYTDEGIALRQAGITLPIMVLNPDTATYDALFRYHLEPEIYDLTQLETLGQYRQPLDIHLNFDTGMNRLGLQENQLEKVLNVLSQYPNLKVASVFSHLVASDDKSHQDFTLHQLGFFKKMAHQIEKGLGYSILKHILNTAGIVHYPNYQMDMVRLGLGLYGVDVTQQLTHQLELVSRLKSYISQIKEVKAAETIGYNRSGVAQRDSKIATVSIGYGDGLMRLSGNGKFAFKVHGQLAPIIGNVCMDMCMIDVTDIPHVQEGEEVIIFDNLESLNRLAQACQTISYEILTLISGRVKRVYYQD